MSFKFPQTTELFFSMICFADAQLVNNSSTAQPGLQKSPSLLFSHHLSSPITQPNPKATPGVSQAQVAELESLLRFA